MVKSTVQVSSRLDSYGVSRSVGEIWYDSAGNECYFRDNGTISCRTVNEEPSMTIQSEADKLDIEVCRRIYERTNQMPYFPADPARYGVQSGDDYHTLVFKVQQAQDEFMTLDARIRDRFDNDPGKLLDYVRDPKNRSEAIQLGLMADDSIGSTPQASQVPQGAESTPPNGGV